MSYQESVVGLADFISSAQSCMVVLGNRVSYDQMAAAVSLTQLFGAADKEVILAAPNKSDETMETILDIERVQDKLGNQNLSIKFPYKAESVDKVSYHISDDNETFYLLIKPQKGFKPLDSSQVTFDHTGSQTDLLFLFGVHQWEMLEHLYDGFEDFYQNTNVVSFHTFETEIGNFKIDITSQGSYSRAVHTLAKLLSLEVPVDAATNLISGIDMVTEGLTSSTTNADTFETIADLLRLGGRRLQVFRRASAAPAQLGQTTFSEFKPNNNQLFAHSMEKKVISEASKQKNKKKRKSEPGSLDYQPGAEGNVGRG